MRLVLWKVDAQQCLCKKNVKEKDHLEDIGVEGKEILYYISRKSVGRMRTGLRWLRICTCKLFRQLIRN